jgi:transposase
MIQLTPQMRILVAIEPADFRKGIDGLARVCQEVLQQDPFSGWVFVFRNRPATALKVLIYDGQGFWLCHKRLSSGRFRWWPTAPHAADQACSASAPAGARALAAHQLHVLLSAGNPEAVQAAPAWRPVGPDR